jgi:membrane protein
MLDRVEKAIDDLIWGRHIEARGRLGRALAQILRFLYGMLRDVFSTQLTLRAMSLVYTTLLSIVPLLAVSFSVAKGLGMVSRLREMFTQSFTQLGPDGVAIAENILQMVDRIDGRAIGAIGVVIFLWTAVSMIQKVESSFNYVWYVAKTRGFARRFSEYLVVLLIGPVAMGTAFSMIASLSSNSFVAYLEKVPGIAQIFLLVGESVPYVMIIGMFTFLYYFMPNTKVSMKSALVGGLAGGVMWVTMSVIFTTFIANSFRTFAVYASFGVGIIALLWLYLNWLVLLLGAQLAFYHQNPAFLRIGRQEPDMSNGMRERLALNIMTVVGNAFRNRKQQVSLTDIGQILSVPTLVLGVVASALEKDGLLVVAETDKLMPGREMSRIRLQDILNVVRVQGELGYYRDPNWGREVDALGGRLDEAVVSVVGDRSLADFLDEMETTAG